MRHPRFRITIGRVMAWVAFAALHLAALGAIYRTTRPSRRMVATIACAISLLIVHLFGVFARKQLRAIRAAFSEPTWEGRAVGCTPLVILVAVIPPMVILLGSFLCAAFDLYVY